MGTMGTCAWIARWNAPFLNGSRSGVLVYDRVPSGKMKTLCFSRCMCAAAPSKAARAKANLNAGGVIDLVEIREGDALETLSVDLPEAIDFVLLDGAKSLYPEILSLLESRLKPGALIVADNADMSPDYLKRVRTSASGYMSVPFAEDVELSMRVG